MNGVLVGRVTLGSGHAIGLKIGSSDSVIISLEVADLLIEQMITILESVGYLKSDEVEGPVTH